jgi:hypothetical protein
MLIMNPELLRSINKEVYRRFPDLAGKKPKVQPRPITAANASRTYLFVYQGMAVTASGAKLPRLVRVVVSEEGKILKVTTSH